MLNGEKTRHEPVPTYLGVTLDRSLIFKEHLTWTARKLKSRNNLLTKLAGTSSIVLCYSVAEYCAPRSAHVGLVDSQLNSTMRLITGTLKPTSTPWVHVLANIAPPSLRWKEATDKLISKISDRSHWPVYKNINKQPEHPSTWIRPA